jgi:probable phosphoglycerate mutase
MAKILLVRHGHVEGIDPRRFRGRMDVPLTAQGRRQALAVARCIAARWRPSVVYTSPLQRCVQTGRDIAIATAVDCTVLSELNDLDYGTWQWRTHAEVHSGWPELFELWLIAPQLLRFPGGESLQDLVARMADVLRMVLERHASDTVVLVGHDSGIRTLLLQLLDQPISAYWRLLPHPGSISEVDVSSREVRVVSVNDTQHLYADGANE